MKKGFFSHQLCYRRSLLNKHILYLTEDNRVDHILPFQREVSLTTFCEGVLFVVSPDFESEKEEFCRIMREQLEANRLLTVGEAIIQNHPSGKMARQYAGLEPDKFASQKVLNPTPDRITKLGIARTFQNIRLFRSMTVFDNVLTAMHLRMKAGIFSDVFRISWKEEQAMRQETEELLRRQDLWQFRDELATSLPYGKQRRLEIARALATKPDLLLLDEPAAGMNPQETQELADFIREIKDEYDLTVLMIEHHMDLVMRISDRIYVLDFGSLIAEGTPEEVQSNQRVIDAYLGVAEDV